MALMGSILERRSKVTGGAIEPRKCWTYLVHFEWDHSEWSYGRVPESKLYAYDANNVKKEIKMISPSRAEEMLGVFLSPDGSDQKQIDHMLDKTTKLGEYINNGHVQKHEAWLALTTMALKAIEYPLPVLNLSESDMTTIMWPLLKNFLPKSSINRYI